jgi:cephalosporin hydroxylase
MRVTVKPLVETAQDEFELARLLQIVAEAAPFRILEVGTWHGGTLWHWLQNAATVVAVDDTMYEANDWQGWADSASATLELLQGSSHDPEIVERARALGPYQFLFIDAGHEYPDVKADWENYSPLVDEGGIVAFHDIQPRQSYGVSQLWDELKRERRSLEVWGGTEAYCGIGVLWM